MRVTPEFFSTFGVPPLRGRHFTVSDAGGPPALMTQLRVLAARAGRRGVGPGRHGDAERHRRTRVVGIMPADFDVRLLDRPEGAAFWTLFRPGERGYEPGGNGAVAIVARLADGVTASRRPAPKWRRSCARQSPRIRSISISRREWQSVRREPQLTAGRQHAHRSRHAPDGTGSGAQPAVDRIDERRRAAARPGTRPPR